MKKNRVVITFGMILGLCQTVSFTVVRKEIAPARDMDCLVLRDEQVKQVKYSVSATHWKEICHSLDSGQKKQAMRVKGFKIDKAQFQVVCLALAPMDLHHLYESFSDDERVKVACMMPAESVCLQVMCQYVLPNLSVVDYFEAKGYKPKNEESAKTAKQIMAVAHKVDAMLLQKEERKRAR